MSKELIAATTQELEGWPDTSMALDNQGKHCRVVLSYKDQTRFVVVSKTPSDRRAMANHIAIVRRELRGMGAAKSHVQKPEKPIVAAIQPPIIKEEIPMKVEGKIDAIFTAIGELRYGDMMTLAELLAAEAARTNLRRSRTADWARLLHGIAGMKMEGE